MLRRKAANVVQHPADQEVMNACPDLIIMPQYPDSNPLLTLRDISVVIMAKNPSPGYAKTRLLSDRFNEDATAEIAINMLKCVVERVSSITTDITLVISPDDAASTLAERLGYNFSTITGQGEGNLGQRIDRIWKTYDKDQPVAFFGMDSPDIPFSHFAEIPKALRSHDIAIGPVEDGGYWTIAVSNYCPQVLKDIDWGSEHVYHQTVQRAKENNLRLAHLPPWHDVDDEVDFDLLMKRLETYTCNNSAVQDNALDTLANTLKKIDNLSTK